MDSNSNIPYETIDEGIKKSFDNATRYLLDALFLDENKRYQSSIFMSMLSYEESGKALLLVESKQKQRVISEKEWRKEFCNHCNKNLVAMETVWKDIGFKPKVPDWSTHQARFDFEWKNVFTYVDYDFVNEKWTSPMQPESFGVTDIAQFSFRALDKAADALKCMIRRVKESEY